MADPENGKRSDLVKLLGEKEAGELILADEGGWNELVREIQARNESLLAAIGRLDGKLQQTNAAVEAAGKRIETVEGGVVAIQNDLKTFKTEIEPQYFRVRLWTSEVHYAIGQLAEITAEVSDLRGQPVPNRPWVDFIASWGQFQPAEGFEQDSLGGAGDRTISVRTDDDGRARVRLRAEVVEAISERDEHEVSTFLETGVPGADKSIGRVILDASTSIDADAAFAIVTEEYDRRLIGRPDPKTVLHRYADAYYAQNNPRVKATVEPEYEWRDYRGTVLAFAKTDADPKTPDQSRGAASIQVTFRDWVRPWILMHYMAPDRTTGLVNDVVERVGASAGKPEEVEKQVASVIAEEDGLIAQARTYEAARIALDRVEAEKDVDLDTVKTAVELQQSVVLFSRMGRIGF
jgi:hypothetical protein